MRGQEQVTHTCNLSYSGDRDHEDCGSKPALANSSQEPISKSQKGLAEWLKMKGPEFKPQYLKKKKKKRKKRK
jgi:hypothetical protein